MRYGKRGQRLSLPLCCGGWGALIGSAALSEPPGTHAAAGRHFSKERPMSVDENTVRRIARLARIAVRDEDVAPLAKELSAILDWVEQLGEVETRNVPPMTSVVEMEMKMREDLVTVKGLQKEVTRAAPEGQEGFFVVPKVVE